ECHATRLRGFGHTPCVLVTVLTRVGEEQRAFEHRERRRSGGCVVELDGGRSLSAIGGQGRDSDMYVCTGPGKDEPILERCDGRRGAYPRAAGQGGEMREGVISVDSADVDAQRHVRPRHVERTPV